MLAASAVFQAIFLSPLLVVLLVATGILLVRRNRRRAGVIILTATAVLLFAFSTGIVSGALLKPLEYRWPAFSDPSPGVEAIVILGGGVREGAPDEGGAPALSQAAKARLVYGFDLSRRLGATVYVSGGRPWRESGGQSEAEVSARMLLRWGLPAERVVTEGASTTTWENARFLAPLLSARGIRRVALVTSAVHMPRARIAFRRAGIETVPAPTDYLSQSKRLSSLDFVPAFGALRDSFGALQEYVGIVLYTLRR